MSQKLLARKQVAAITGLTPRWLMELAKKGDGPPYIRLGARRLAYPEDAFNAWLASRTFKHRAAEITGRAA